MISPAPSPRRDVFVRVASEALGLSRNAVETGLVLSAAHGVSPIVGVGAVFASGYAVNVRTDRDGWNLRKGAEMAQGWVAKHPALGEFTLEQLTNPAPFVMMVEHRHLLAEPGPHDPNVSTDLLFVGSSYAKAVEYVVRNTIYAVDPAPDLPWCLSVYGIEIDDPEGRPIDMKFFGRDGIDRLDQNEAMHSAMSSPHKL